MMTMDRHADFIAFCDGHAVGLFDEHEDRVFEVVVVANRGASATTLANRILYNNRKARAAGRRIVKKAKQWMKLHRYAARFIGPRANSKVYLWRQMTYFETVFGQGRVEASNRSLYDMLVKK